MGQPVVHWEFWSEDPKRVSDFYGMAFGWDTTELPQINYHLVDTDSGAGINGGIMTPQQGPWPAKVCLYIDVDDLDAHCSRVEAAGGRIIVPRQEVEGVGILALFEDPDGRIMGMWQRPEQN